MLPLFILLAAQQPQCQRASGDTAIAIPPNVDQLPVADTANAGPTYPGQLRQAGVQGVVRVAFTVDTAGAVERPTIVIEARSPIAVPLAAFSDFATLDSAARDSAEEAALAVLIAAIAPAKDSLTRIVCISGPRDLQSDPDHRRLVRLTRPGVAVLRPDSGPSRLARIPIASDSWPSAYCRPRRSSSNSTSRTAREEITIGAARRAAATAGGRVASATRPG